MPGDTLAKAAPFPEAGVRMASCPMKRASLEGTPPEHPEAKSPIGHVPSRSSAHVAVYGH